MYGCVPDLESRGLDQALKRRWDLSRLLTNYANDYCKGKGIPTQPQQRYDVGFLWIKVRQQPENGTYRRPFDARLVRQGPMKCTVAILFTEVVVRRVLIKDKRDVGDVGAAKHYWNDAAVFNCVVQQLVDRPAFPRRTLSLPVGLITGEAPLIRFGAYGNDKIGILYLLLHPTRPSFWWRNVVPVDLAGHALPGQPVGQLQDSLIVSRRFVRIADECGG